jgi:hypothetical protein
MRIVDVAPIASEQPDLRLVRSLPLDRRRVRGVIQKTAIAFVASSASSCVGSCSSSAGPAITIFAWSCAPPPSSAFTPAD